jgi:hypothetical protein
MAAPNKTLGQRSGSRFFLSRLSRPGQSMPRNMSKETMNQENAKNGTGGPPGMHYHHHHRMATLRHAGAAISKFPLFLHVPAVTICKISRDWKRGAWIRWRWLQNETAPLNWLAVWLDRDDDPTLCSGGTATEEARYFSKGRYAMGIGYVSDPSDRWRLVQVCISERLRCPVSLSFHPYLICPVLILG